MSTVDCCFTNENNWFRFRAAAVIVEEGCVLMITNEKADYYYSIGGGVHMGETAEEAVKREVFEETGVHYEVERLLFVHENFFVDELVSSERLCHEVAFYFLMKPKGSLKLPKNESFCFFGRESLKWIPIEEYGNFKAYPEFLGRLILNLPQEVKHIITNEIKS